MVGSRPALRRGLLLVVVVPFALDPVPPPLGPAQVAGAGPLTGEEIYSRYCAVCHGDRGEGVPGYTRKLAPVLASRSADQLRQTIKDGKPGTEMPAWGTLLSEEEVDGLLRFLKQWGGRQ